MISETRKETLKLSSIAYMRWVSFVFIYIRYARLIVGIYIEKRYRLSSLVELIPNQGSPC